MDRRNPTIFSPPPYPHYPGPTIQNRPPPPPQQYFSPDFRNQVKPHSSNPYVGQNQPFRPERVPQQPEAQPVIKNDKIKEMNEDLAKLKQKLDSMIQSNVQRVKPESVGSLNRSSDNLFAPYQRMPAPQNKASLNNSGSFNYEKNLGLRENLSQRINIKSEPSEEIAFTSNSSRLTRNVDEGVLQFRSNVRQNPAFFNEKRRVAPIQNPNKKEANIREKIKVDSLASQSYNFEPSVTSSYQFKTFDLNNSAENKNSSRDLQLPLKPEDQRYVLKKAADNDGKSRFDMILSQRTQHTNFDIPSHKETTQSTLKFSGDLDSQRQILRPTSIEKRQELSYSSRQDSYRLENERKEKEQKERNEKSQREREQKKRQEQESKQREEAEKLERQQRQQRQKQRRLLKEQQEREQSERQNRQEKERELKQQRQKQERENQLVEEKKREYQQKRIQQEIEQKQRQEKLNQQFEEKNRVQEERRIQEQREQRERQEREQKIEQQRRQREQKIREAIEKEAQLREAALKQRADRWNPNNSTDATDRRRGESLDTEEKKIRQNYVMEAEKTKVELQRRISSLELENGNIAMQRESMKEQIQRLRAKLSEIQAKYKELIESNFDRQSKEKVLKQKISQLEAQLLQHKTKGNRNSFDNVLKEQLEETAQLKHDLEAKTDQVIRLNDIILMNRRKAEEAINEASIQKLKNISEIKQITQKNQIAILNLENEKKTMKHAMETLASKLQAAVQDNKAKDEFLQQHLVGRAKSGEEQTYVREMLSKYQIQFPINNLMEKLLEEQKLIRSLKQRLGEE